MYVDEGEEEEEEEGGGGEKANACVRACVGALSRSGCVPGRERGKVGRVQRVERVSRVWGVGCRVQGVGCGV